MGLYRDHQQLLLSAGLAGAVEESQLRLSNSFSEGSSSTATSTTPQQEALRLIALGMEDALTQARGVSLSAIEAQGLSAADVFHSEVLNTTVVIYPCYYIVIRYFDLMTVYRWTIYCV